MKVYVLTRFETGTDYSNDTAVSVLGVFKSKLSANLARDQTISQIKDINIYDEAIYVIETNTDDCFEVIGIDGYFYQLLIIEKEVEENSNEH